MLTPESSIAIIAPSGIFDPNRLEKGMQVLSSWGYRPTLLPGASARWRYLAGDDDTRLSDLEEAFSGRYDAVWMARGGYGAARLLPRIDWRRIQPVPFFGFSDGTVLLNVIGGMGRPAIHGPVVHTLGDLNDDATRDHLRRLLAGEAVEPMAGTMLIPGEATGPLVGGNLCLLASMCGTPAQLRAAGCIVVLEDIYEPPYKVDRLLTQLIASRCLEGAVGFALGSFIDANPPEGADWTQHDLLVERLAAFGVPVLADLPIGHGPANRAFQVGARAQIRDEKLWI